MITPIPRAISLVELVVVIVILGVLAALAVPRFSRGADAIAIDEVRENLTILRTAIDLYYQDHGAFPGQRCDGTEGGIACSEAAFVSQLTRYSNTDGLISDSPRQEFRFGPDLRLGVPGCPVAGNPGARRVLVVQGSVAPQFVPDTADVGWIFNCQTGFIAANSDGQGPEGVRYDRY
jgi:general secretion pathway protein G